MSKIPKLNTAEMSGQIKTLADLSRAKTEPLIMRISERPWQ
jgi:hypothetical protein